MDVRKVYSPDHKRLSESECNNLYSAVGKKLADLGYDYNIESVTHKCSFRVTNIRLADKKLQEDGYNISPYTGRRGRVLNWDNWVEVNNAINEVFDEKKMAGKISSLNNQFKIRDGKTAFTEDEWEEKAYGNVGSQISPVYRKDAWGSEGIPAKLKKKK